MDEPMQTVKPVVTTKIGGESNMDKINWKIVEMAQNELSSEEDYIGLFESEPEVQTFFSLEKEYQSTIDYPIRTGQRLKQPRTHIEI